MPANLADPSDDSQALSAVPPETPLADYLTWTNRVHASPPVYHLACALAFSAYTLCRRGFSIETDLKTIHPALQFVLLGPSGCGKSTAIDLGYSFADDVWEESGVTIANPRVQPNGSVPGIMGALQELYDRRHNITPGWLVHDEVAQVFNSREPVAELLCQLSDGRTIEHRTKTAQRQANKAELERLIRPRIVGLFASTEAQLAPHFKESHRSGGVFSRMLWVRPPVGEEHDRRMSVTPEFIAERTALRQAAIGSFANWEGQLSMIADQDGLTFALAPEADEAILAFHRELKAQTDDDGLQGQRKRASDRVFIIAAIFAAQRLRLEVKLEDVERAANLLRLLLRYAGATLDSDELAGDLLERLCTRVEKVILAAGEPGLRRSEIYKLVRIRSNGHSSPSDVLNTVLTTLEDRELIVGHKQRDYERQRTAPLRHITTAAGKRYLKTRDEPPTRRPN